MKVMKVKIVEEYRGNTNPERRYHLMDIETGKEPVRNLKKQEIPCFIKNFHLTLVETEEQDMTDKETMDLIFKHLKMFMIESNWLDNNTPEQARALFTTICLMGDINPDTAVCDNMLLELYKDSDMETIEISYKEFDLFMCGLLV